MPTLGGSPHRLTRLTLCRVDSRARQLHAKKAQHKRSERGGEQGRVRTRGRGGEKKRAAHVTGLLDKARYNYPPRSDQMAPTFSPLRTYMYAGVRFCSSLLGYMRERTLPHASQNRSAGSPKSDHDPDGVGLLQTQTTTNTKTESTARKRLSTWRLSASASTSRPSKTYQHEAHPIKGRDFT